VNRNRQGNYFHISHASEQVVVVLFTFLPSGAPVWYMAQLTPANAEYRFSGQLYSVEWANGSAVKTVRGSLKLDPTSKGSALLSWTLDDVSGQESIEYQIYGNASQPNLTGAWYAPSSSGWGEFLDAQGSTMMEFVALFDASGQPTWLQGQGSASGGTTQLSKSTGQNLCLGCPGWPSVSTAEAGLMSITNINATRTAASLNISLLEPLNGWNRTNLPLARLTQ
jgi:hypothetical protein